MIGSAVSGAPLRYLAMFVVGVLLLTLGPVPSWAEEEPPQADDLTSVCDVDAIGDGQFEGEGGVHGTAIECLVAAGIVLGLDDGSFGSEQPLRRDQTATIIVRFLAVALGGPVEPSPSTFDDVAPTNTHANAIGALQSLGIVQGRSETIFDPAGLVTRGQLASILVNMLDVLDDEALNGSYPPPAQQTFDDVDGSVHADNIAALAALGVIRGTGEGRFEPHATVTRGQAATMFINTAVIAAGIGVWAPADHDTEPDEETPAPAPTPPPGTTPPPGDNGEAVNQPPTVTSIDPQTATEGQPFELQVQAADPDDDDLSYSVTGLPTGLSIDATGLVSGAPEPGTSDTSPYTVEVTVSDGTDQAATDFTLTVQAAAELLIFRDDFDRAELGSDWKVEAGDWSIDGDVLSTSSSGIVMWNEQLSAEVREQGYYLEARVRKDGANGIGLVAGRTSQQDNGTHIFPHLFQETEARLGTWNGDYTELQHVSFPNGYGTWFDLRIEVRGRQAVVIVNGKERAAASDIRFDPGLGVGLRASAGSGSSFEFDWFEVGPLEPAPPADDPDPLSPGALLASESFDQDDGTPWGDEWETRLFGNGGNVTVEDGMGTLEAQGSGNIDLYAARNDVALDDGYQSLIIRWDGTTRGGAAVMFRHVDSPAGGTTQPDAYRLFWIPWMDNGLWIRHTKDGSKTTLTSSAIWDDAPAGDYLLEGGVSGQELKVRVTPVGAPQRAADDWDLEDTHTGPDALTTGGTGIFVYVQGGAGKVFQVGRWDLYTLAD